jgi:hypothetical protein
VNIRHILHPVLFFVRPRIILPPLAKKRARVDRGHPGVCGALSRSRIPENSAGVPKPPGFPKKSVFPQKNGRPSRADVSQFYSPALPRSSGAVSIFIGLRRREKAYP